MSFLLQGAVLGGAAAVQPGPLQAYLLSQTIRRGWRASLVMAFAPLASDVPIVLAVLFLLSQLPVSALDWLQLVGGIFLIYLAKGAIQASRQSEPADVQESPDTGRKTMLQAATVNLLNPNPYIFWATISGPIVLKGWGESPFQGVAFLFGFYGIMILGLLGLITLFAAVRRLDSRLSQIMSFLSFVALLGFGLFQLWSGYLAITAIAS